MSERWVREAEEVVKNMPHADVSYYSDFIWCSNEEVEAWFYPDGSCLVSRGDLLESMPIKNAGHLLAEQPPEELFK